MMKLSELRAALKGRTITDVTATHCHGQACLALVLHLDNDPLASFQLVVPVDDDVTAVGDGAPVDWKRGQGQPRHSG